VASGLRRPVFLAGRRFGVRPSDEDEEAEFLRNMLCEGSNAYLRT
jgi:hypothetical protein